jgi:hypothetical protein
VLVVGASRGDNAGGANTGAAYMLVPCHDFSSVASVETGSCSSCTGPEAADCAEASCAAGFSSYSGGSCWSFALLAGIAGGALLLSACIGSCVCRRKNSQHKSKETYQDHPEFDALAAPAIASPAVAQLQSFGSPSAPAPELLQASQARLDRQGTLTRLAEQSMLRQFKQERYADEATARRFLEQAEWNLERAMEQYMPPVPASPVSDRTFSTSRFKASCECRCRTLCTASLPLHLTAFARHRFDV